MPWLPSMLFLLLSAVVAPAADARLASRLNGWKYAAEVHVRNPAPFDRPSEVIDVGLTLPATRTGNLAADARVILKDGFHELIREVPHQIYDIRTQGGYTTCRIAFHADLSANGLQRFAVFYDNPDAKPAAEPVRAKVTAQPNGVAVEAAAYSLHLDTAAGRIQTLDTRHPVPERVLEAPAGNFPLPDVQVRSAAAATGVESLQLVQPAGAAADVIMSGPVFSSFAGRRSLARPNGTVVAVADFTYVFYGRLPYFTVRTSLRFLADVDVAAVEQAGLAARQPLLTHYLFRPVSPHLPLTEMEEIGAVLVEPAARRDISGSGDLLAGIVPVDVAWRSLVNVDSRLALTAFDLGTEEQGPGGVAVTYRPAARARIVDEVVVTTKAPIATGTGATAVVRVPAGTVYTTTQAIHFSEWNNSAWRDATDAAGRRLNTPVEITLYPTKRDTPPAPQTLLHHGARGAAYQRGIR